MSLGKYVAGAVIALGVFKIAERPEVQDAIQEVKTALEASAQDSGPTMTAASRDEMMRPRRGGRPEARVQRRLSPATSRSIAKLYRAREQARAKVVWAMRTYGRNSRQAIDAYAVYQRADAAYHAQVQRRR